ncbi:MAG: DUF2674 domain-containing protein [Pseudomonadota bacterium]
MINKKPEQKLVSFRASDVELMSIQSDIEEGWNIVSLVPSGSYYIGIMEKNNAFSRSEEKDAIYIPPRKKIKFS